MKKITDFGLAVILLLFALSLSIFLTLSAKPLYYFDIEYLNIAQESGCSEDEIRENYDVLIDYNLSWKETELSFPSFSMSENGREHFREVRVIFQFFLKMIPITFVLGIIGIIWKKRRREAGYLKLAGILMIGLPVLAGAVMAISWDDAFVLFHRIFFRNDYWLFDPATDPVINILPDEYFMHCAILLLAVLLIYAGCCFFVYRRLKKCQRSKVRSK